MYSNRIITYSLRLQRVEENVEELVIAQVRLRSIPAASIYKSDHTHCRKLSRQLYGILLPTQYHQPVNVNVWVVPHHISAQYLSGCSHLTHYHQASTCFCSPSLNPITLSISVFSRSVPSIMSISVFSRSIHSIMSISVFSRSIPSIMSISVFSRSIPSTSST
jgi:hypothetical protein